ncbi:MAG TPA: hypothetical protein VMD30_01590 [Tepidisphaeraceae bacterium]|nr:hypothetical protein [Tepidisphaeraceae bacterium]
MGEFTDYWKGAARYAVRASRGRGTAALAAAGVAVVLAIYQAHLGKHAWDYALFTARDVAIAQAIFWGIIFSVNLIRAPAEIDATKSRRIAELQGPVIPTPIANFVAQRMARLDSPLRCIIWQMAVLGRQMTPRQVELEVLDFMGEAACDVQKTAAAAGETLLEQIANCGLIIRVRDDIWGINRTMEDAVKAYFKVNPLPPAPAGRAAEQVKDSSLTP